MLELLQLQLSSHRLESSPLRLFVTQPDLAPPRSHFLSTSRAAAAVWAAATLSCSEERIAMQGETRGGCEREKMSYYFVVCIKTIAGNVT